MPREDWAVWEYEVAKSELASDGLHVVGAPLRIDSELIMASYVRKPEVREMSGVRPHHVMCRAASPALSRLGGCGCGQAPEAFRVLQR